MTHPRVVRRIIDKKRILLTDPEWELYQNICKSYDRPNFSGSSLFAELFETDENGVITFLKPPTRFTSMEVFLFMMSIMQHQHLRAMYEQVDAAVADCQKVTEKANTLIADLEKRREGSS